ncbi:MAG: hypothetical protein KatS3mg060_3456 [Dehalococcoidia bacterium]|nr:MAG: hypothetical protein KatS3mg060_3456 [Dehalococcoidia bacterium]
MTNPVRSAMPVLARHEGVWVGEYTHLDPEGAVHDRYRVRSVCELPDDGSCDFRLRTTNQWPDGRIETIVNEARLHDGRLVWSNGRLVGAMWEIDDLTVYTRFGYPDDPTITVCEMIQISHDGQHRARTWHWFREERLFRITLTKEQRDA